MCAITITPNPIQLGVKTFYFSNFIPLCQFHIWINGRTCVVLQYTMWVAECVRMDTAFICDRHVCAQQHTHNSRHIRSWDSQQDFVSSVDFVVFRFRVMFCGFVSVLCQAKPCNRFNCEDFQCILHGNWVPKMRWKQKQKWIINKAFEWKTKENKNKTK